MSTLKKIKTVDNNIAKLLQNEFFIDISFFTICNYVKCKKTPSKFSFF
uniref:Uncharacterized protein n=1 Tax=Leptosiphonia brodiei TaxID=2608611 RepID=A0A1Z1MAZ4_9FLOR|nr:hypothetical protein [Leptosiphonia brodiei]ARW62985.1 hypothetical protein [Leptosiphonia brodiei]